MKAHIRNIFLLSLLAAALGLILAGQVTAQTFTTLHTFTGTTNDGANPFAGLILSGNRLYGTTEGGGGFGGGTVLAMNTHGTGFTNLHNFTGGSDGGGPAGRLILSGNTLYGTTGWGGSSSNGTVFAVNTDGTGFKNLHSFAELNNSTNSDGADPVAGLILSSNTLFGTASEGGSGGNGTVFSVNTDGTSFTTLYSFTSMPACCPNTNSDGANPVDELTLSGTTLYGTASSGGGSGRGTVFAVNKDGTGFTNLHSFTATAGFGLLSNNSDGAIPNGVIVAGDALYGTARFGGTLGLGTLFKVNTNGTGFTNLHSFMLTGVIPWTNDGAYPNGGLALSGNVLYGTAAGIYLGASSFHNTNHTVFKINTDGTGFAVLHSFSEPSGSSPTNSDGFDVRGGLILSNTTLYGTAFYGGASGYGTVFSLSVPVEFAYTTNNGTITITSYTCRGSEVAIPEAINDLPVTRIEGYALSGCALLTDTTIPNSITSIGAGAFYGCANLTNVMIGNNVTNVGMWTFDGCSSLKHVTIPNSLSGISGSMFFDCTSLPNVEIPQGVTTIGEDAFFDCYSLAEVTIPNSVTNIGGSAFAYCTSLTNVTIPSSVSTIEPNAFYFCTSLTNVTIPNSVTIIRDNAFEGCISLTSIAIPANVTSIDQGAFSYCTGLTNVTIPISVTNIGSGVFDNSTSLTAITVDPMNPRYSSVAGVLLNKNQTTLIEFPEGKVGSYTVPNTVTTIGQGAFFRCGSLASVTIPNSVTSIGDNAFQGCTGLISVAIPTNVTSVGDNAFQDCTGLTSVTIPNSVTSIGDFMFFSCTHLSNIRIPDSVTSIGNYAFYSCSSLTSITIPNSVTNIGDYAFRSCAGLGAVFFRGNAPSVGSISFSGNPATVFYLPRTTGWLATFSDLPTMLWKPQMQTDDASFGVRTNQFAFTIDWASSMTVAVEACTNLANPIWSPLTTNTLIGDSSYFSDPQWTNYPGRFYRLRMP